MRANPAYLGFDGICRRFEIIISATERILAAAQTIIPGTERSLSATQRILAVASKILCRMEKTVSLTDFIPDARGIMSAKPSRIAGETEIIIGEASLNPSGCGCASPGWAPIATTICFPVPERTLDAVPTGVFLTPICQQRTVRRKTMAQHIRTCRVSNLILRAHDHTYQRTNQRR